MLSLILRFKYRVFLCLWSQPVTKTIPLTHCRIGFRTRRQVWSSAQWEPWSTDGVFRTQPSPEPLPGRRGHSLTEKGPTRAYRSTRSPTDQEEGPRWYRPRIFNSSRPFTRNLPSLPRYSCHQGETEPRNLLLLSNIFLQTELVIKQGLLVLVTKPLW